MRSNSTWGRRPAHSGLVPPYVARPTINRGWIASGAFFAKPSLGETGFLRNSRNPNCRESVLENESLFWKIMSGADAGLVTGTTPRRTWKLLGSLRAERFEVPLGRAPQRGTENVLEANSDDGGSLADCGKFLTKRRWVECRHGARRTRLGPRWMARRLERWLAWRLAWTRMGRRRRGRLSVWGLRIPLLRLWLRIPRVLRHVQLPVLRQLRLQLSVLRRLHDRLLRLLALLRHVRLLIRSRIRTQFGPRVAGESKLAFGVRARNFWETKTDGPRRAADRATNNPDGESRPRQLLDRQMITG